MDSPTDARSHAGFGSFKESLFHYSVLRGLTILCVKAISEKATASGAQRFNGVGKPLVLALHSLPAGDLAIARRIEGGVADLDISAALVVADDQTV